MIVWLPLIAIAAHLFEEFVWPGGFAEWYRHYPPGFTVPVSATLLIVVNVVFVALALVPPLLGANARGWGYWALVAAIAGANGIFHVNATIRTRMYSPGVVTGTLLFIPLAVVGIAQLWRAGAISVGTLAQDLLIAFLYVSWSSWRHRRDAIRA